jgi:hypothetical protein
MIGRTSSAAPAHLRNARGELDRRVEIVGLVHEIAAQRFLDGDKRSSVVSVLPSCIRTVVAFSAGCSSRPGLTPGVSAIALHSA